VPAGDRREAEAGVLQLSPEDLRALHQVHLDMLLEIRRVCGELGLTFQLGGGTLLGAVRHGGFIPWDDDADVFMPRRHYARFLAEAPGHLRPGYVLQTFRSDPGYDFLYAKLRRDGTEFREVSRQARREHHGIYVDVFPLDVVQLDRWWGRLHLRAVMAIRRLDALIFAMDGRISARHAAWKRGLARAVSAAGKFLPQSFFLATADGLCALLRNSDRGLLGVLTSDLDVARVKKLLKTPAQMASGRTLPFEGTAFPVPAEPEAVLRQGYGDFMALPPEHLRRPRHAICVLRMPAPPV